MATLSDMETEVCSVIGIGGPTATPTGTEKTLVDGWLNDGVVDVLLRTGCYVDSATATETSGDGDYDLDTAILVAKSLRWTSASTSVSSYPERVPVSEIERLRASYVTVDTASVPAAFFAVAGANKLMVWPTPADTDTLTVYYVPRPTAMSSGTDDPSDATFGGVPSEFHPGVKLYAEWKAADWRDDGSSAQGERYRIQYEGQDGRGGVIARYRKHTYLHGGRPGRSVFHPSRRRWPVKNDVY